MGLFTIGRVIARGIANAIKQSGYVSISHISPEVFNQTSIVRQTNVFKQVWLNFTVRSYNCTNFAAHLRRKASQNFLQRNASKIPMVAFAGFCLTDKGTQKEKETSIASLFEYLTSDLDSLWKDSNNDATVFPSQFAEYDIGERLGKPSSNAAVYSANYNGDEVALKIMFNYAFPSNSAAISQAFEREYQVLPCSSASVDGTADCISLKRDNKEHVLEDHPNVMKIHGKFIDNTPLLHDSLETYPMALPRTIHHDGNGRNKTMCLVMPKYTFSLRGYLHANNISNHHRVSIFHQLLEGVSHLEQHGISHRDLKSDNILIDHQDDGHPRVVITDFGCCLAEENMLLPYTSVYTDRGGNFALLAPEIANAAPGDGIYLDYSKSDAWTCGTLAYEIFNQDNPFYTHLQNTDYDDEGLQEIPVYSGYPLIDKVVYGLLQKNPMDRLSASQASTILALILNAPPEWLILPCIVTKMEVERWLLVLSINTRRGYKLYGDPRFLPPNILLNLVFLSRITSAEILDALVLVRKLRF